MELFPIEILNNWWCAVRLVNEATHPVGAQQVYDKNIGFKLISILWIMLAINIFPIPGKPLILTFVETGLSSLYLDIWNI